MVAAVVKDIERHARKVQSSDEIAQVGTSSANGDRAIGKMIAEAKKRVGNEGVITSRRPIPPRLGPSASSRGCSPTGATSRPISSPAPRRWWARLPILEAVVQTGKPLLIVAEDIERRRHRSGRRRGLAARQGRGRQAQGQ
jgi:chaperonin GroEL